jgi:hypothetical protein
VVVSRIGVAVAARAFNDRSEARGFLRDKIDRGAEAHKGPTGIDGCTVVIPHSGQTPKSELTYRLVVPF